MYSALSSMWDLYFCATMACFVLCLRRRFLCSNGDGVCADGPQHPQVFVFELFEVMLQLVMPWVENKHLESERRRGDAEVRQGYDACGPHFGKGRICRVFRNSNSGDEMRWLELRVEDCEDGAANLCT
jgi:hypothetical protein